MLNMVRKHSLLNWSVVAALFVNLMMQILHIQIVSANNEHSLAEVLALFLYTISTVCSVFAE